MTRPKRMGLGALLMTLSMLVVLVGLERLRLGMGLEMLLTIALLIPAAAFGAAMVRRGACWREVVITALVATAALLLMNALFRFAPAYGLGFGTYPGVWRDQLQQGVLHLVIGTAGAFVLPLADQVVRLNGPAPNRRRLLLTSLIGILVVMFIEYTTVQRWGGFGYSFFGLGTLAMGAITAVVLIGLGIGLAVGGRTEWGANLGGAGLILAAFAILVWVSTGMRWFP